KINHFSGPVGAQKPPETVLEVRRMAKKV
ncbi:uncharacterized protein METZ01_LOCUS114576, partial [marine metagenome]